MKRIALLLVVILALVSSFALAEDITYPSRGVDVPATVIVPEGQDEINLVVMMHGHGGSRDEYLGFPVVAQALADKGIATIRMDFPGCGASTEPFTQNDMTNMKADVLAAIDYMKANYKVDDIGLFGYSMGGRIALELLAEKAVDPEAVVLLAPAADNEDLKKLFGGHDAWEEMYEKAKADGFYTFTTIYGQVQDLSAKWFEDLAVYEDVAADAAKAWDEDDVLVICGSDDEAVDPENVSKVVAEKLGGQVVDATGEGHGYGFYTEDDDTVRNLVATATADFFAKELD